MILQTNFNLKWKDISKLYDEVSFLAQKYENWFDWRIFSHPLTNEKLILKKALKNPVFINSVSSHFRPIDRTLIEFFMKNKPLKMVDLKHITSSSNLMIVKHHNFIQRLSYHKYKLTQHGLDYLIARIYPYWCHFQEKHIPSQRSLIYRLASSNDSEHPTQLWFEMKLGFRSKGSGVGFYERINVATPSAAQKLMKRIEANIANKNLILNLKDKEGIKTIFDNLGANRYQQICKAAKLVHPRLKERLSKTDYHLFQISKLKYVKPSKQEQKVIQQLSKNKIDFEIHPIIHNFHFDFAVPSSQDPKIIIEAIKHSYDLEKIDKIKKLLPKSIIIGVISVNMREGFVLIFKKHFDLVFKDENLPILVDAISDILRNKVPIQKSSTISAHIENISSNLWQGNAEKTIRDLLDKNGFKLSKNYFHEPTITIMVNGYPIDSFKPDFLVMNGSINALIETTEIGRNTKRRRLNELASRFEIYKKMLNLDYKTILVLFIKTEVKEEELYRLKRFCDLILFNNDLEKLCQIVQGE